MVSNRTRNGGAFLHTFLASKGKQGPLRNRPTRVRPVLTDGAEVFVIARRKLSALPAQIGLLQAVLARPTRYPNLGKWT